MNRVGNKVVQRTPGAALIALALLAGCGPAGSESARDSAGSEWAYEETFGDGPVQLVMRLDNITATLADRLILEQELRVEPGWEGDFPEYLPDDFEGFSVVHIERPAAPRVATAANASVAADGAAPRGRRKRLELEPDRSGTLAIAPLEVWFQRSSESEEEAAATEASFLTAEIEVDIAAPEDAAGLELRAPRDIFAGPPVEDEGGWSWAIAGALAVVAVALGGVVLVWRRRRAVGPPAVPPHEIAYESLRRLVALGLVEKGEVELFFVHLSSIVREYIEGRFGVHAPERTTQEFLREAARHGALGRHQEGLSRFLGLCDQVKFARFEPDESAIQQAFDTVKTFIEETRADADATARAA